MATWHVLTGEFPPQPGGVSDYTDQLCRALARRGQEVHVWAPGFGLREETLEPGLALHRLPHGFTPRGVLELRKKIPRGARVLLQYVPTAFGLRGMNLPFCAWIAKRRPWVMFHEVAYPFGEGRARTNILAAANTAMAMALLAGAGAVLSSTSAWVPKLRALMPPSVQLPDRHSLSPSLSHERTARSPREIHVVPVPSNLPTTVPPQAPLAVRRALKIPEDSLLVGHFGTYGAHVRPLIEAIIPALAARAHILLLGRGNSSMSAPERVLTPRASEPESLAAHLAACDLLIQPFSDGVTTRRTSLMAGLALGVPTVTNRGFLTEPEWAALRPVALATDSAPQALLTAAAPLLDSPALRTELGQRGAEVYRMHFSLEHLLEVLESLDRR